MVRFRLLRGQSLLTLVPQGEEGRGQWRESGTDAGRTVYVLFFRSCGFMRLNLGTYRLFDLVKRTASRHMGFANAGLGFWDYLGAVDHVFQLLTERRELAHCLGEGGPHVILVLDVLLPIASRARIYQRHWLIIRGKLRYCRHTSGDKIVGLKAHFSFEGMRRGHFS